MNDSNRSTSATNTSAATETNYIGNYGNKLQQQMTVTAANDSDGNK